MLKFSMRMLTLLTAAAVMAACSGGNLMPATTMNPTQKHVTPNFVQQYPTTKDQCKDGGWETYGIFKNQGDCVSYVNHE